jgi:hypothetical protein
MVSTTVASFASADQSSVDNAFPGIGFPNPLASLRQVYRVYAEMLSCLATSATVRLSGGINFFRIVPLRSAE